VLLRNFTTQKYKKNIYIIASTFYLYSVVLYLLKVQHLQTRRIFFFCTQETTRKINIASIKVVSKICELVTLLQMIIGIEVLAVSSITGKAKNNVTTTQLCEKKLKFIKRILKIFNLVSTYNIFGIFHLVKYLH
jgi:hypothetical protein